MRKLVITENITLDGSIEMLGDWFDPTAQDEEQLAEMHRQGERGDALLLGRQTFEDFRGFWPAQTDDTTGVTEELNQVQKYVVSSTMTDPQWQNSTVLAADWLAGGPDAQGAGRPRDRGHRQHHAEPCPDRGGAGRRVPAVGLPRRPRGRP